MMMVRKVYRLYVFLGLALVLAVLGNGCGAASAPTPTKAPAVVATPTAALALTPTPAGPQPKYGGIAAFAHRGDPSPSDPMRGGSGDTAYIIMALNSTGGLARECREDQFQVCPNLAKSWESNADSTLWTFNIRDGVTWHDGTPFTAEDARWWLELAIKGVPGRAPAGYAGTLGPIKKIEVVGANKLQVTLSSPMGAFPAVFSQTDRTQIAHPKHLMEGEIAKGNATVAPHEVGWVGTGPFKFAKYEKGSIFQVRRFDRYFDKDKQGRQLPFLEGIDYIIMPDFSNVLAAFRSGRVDRTDPGNVFYFGLERRNQLKNDMGEKMYLVQFAPFGKAVGMNARKPPFNDVKVRQAISLWLDRQSYIDSVEDGFGVPVAVWFPNSPLVNPDVLTWPGWNPKTKEQDRKRARELLAEAGFQKGFPVSILTGTPWVTYSEWLKGQLDGLLGAENVRIEVLDVGTWNTRRCQGSFDLINTLSAGVQARHSPEIVAGGYVSTNACSFMQHDDKKVDEFFARIAATGNQAERVRLAREVERYLSIESWLALNIAVEKTFVAFRSYVKGWTPPQVTPYSSGDYADVWLDK